MVQRLRICLAMQRTRVKSLVRAQRTKLLYAMEPLSRVPQLLSSGTTAREPVHRSKRSRLPR